MGNRFTWEEALLLVKDEGPRKIRTFVAGNPEAAVKEFLNDVYPKWILSRYFGRFPGELASEAGFRDFMGTCILFYCIGWCSNNKLLAEALSEMGRRLKGNNQK